MACKCNNGYSGDYTQRAPWKAAYSGATTQEKAKKIGDALAGLMVAAVFIGGVASLPGVGSLMALPEPAKK